MRRDPPQGRRLTHRTFSPFSREQPLAHFFKEPSDCTDDDASNSAGEAKSEVDQLTLLRTARCNIIDAKELGGEKMSTIDCCGNLIVEAYQTGYKQRDPGLAYWTLKDVPAERRNKRSGVAEDIERTEFDGGGGFFSSGVFAVHADPINGLVWAGTARPHRHWPIATAKRLAGNCARSGREICRRGVASTRTTRQPPPIY